MLLQPDAGDVRYRIRSYSPERALIINDTEHHQPMVVTPDALYADLLPDALERFSVDHLATLCELKPEVLLLGTGKTQQLPKPEWMSAAREKGVALEWMSTAAACRTFTLLSVEQRFVVAALFL